MLTLTKSENEARAGSFVILSADSFDAFEERCKASNLSIQRCEGFYKGEFEPAWIVSVEDFTFLRQHLAHTITHQESFLHLGPADDKGRRPATIEYNHTRAQTYKAPENIGELYQCDRATAKRHAYYTKRGDSYWVTTKTPKV